MIQLSVIVPTYNRSLLLGACLQALAEQTEPPQHFEVIVVVDGSTDDTRAMLAALKTPYRLTALFQPNAGPAAARNAGLKAATGEYCLFIDDDIVAHTGLVGAHLYAQSTHPNTVTVGRIDTVVTPNSGGFAQYLADCWKQHFMILESADHSLSFTDCWSGNLCAPRRALQAIGGFATDITSNEDIELGGRLQRHGLSLMYVGGAIGRQHYGKRFATIARDCEKNGVAAVEIARRHPAVLPALELGGFNRWGIAVATIRRVLLASAPPVGLLGVLNRLADLLPKAISRYWYASLYDYFYWRGARRAMGNRSEWRQLTRGTVILMYHAFGNRGERASRYVIPPRRFARQMAWLKRRRYNVISLETYLQHRLGHTVPPARSVVITVDDGYADVHSCAYPILRRYGLPATVFVLSDLAGTGGSCDRAGLENRPLLSCANLREMTAAGIGWGSHGRSHVNLTDMPERQAWDEIHGSRMELERVISSPVRLFAYPYGACDAGIERTVARAGYEAACGIEFGLNDPATPLLRLRRIEIRGGYPLWRFLLALWTGKAWLTRAPR